jgi:hypothetical protein
MAVEEATHCKPSAKAGQIDESQDSFDIALLPSKKLPGSASRGAAAKDAQTGKNESVVEGEQATLQALQMQLNEQTDILKVLARRGRNRNRTT